MIGRRRSLHGLSLTAMIALAGVAFATGTVVAEDFSVGDLVVQSPWARASIGTNRPAAAYVEIVNQGNQADRLVEINTDRAKRAELHTHIMEGDVARMRPIESIEIPAHGSATLAPGGDHVMLMGLTEKLSEGDSFTMELVFEHAGAVSVEVGVGGIAASGPAMDHEGHGTSHGNH